MSRPKCCYECSYFNAKAGHIYGKCDLRGMTKSTTDCCDHYLDSKSNNVQQNDDLEMRIRKLEEDIALLKRLI